IFFSQFDNELLNQQNDSAVFDLKDQRLAFTTDSYVVQPIFFPGGNIGELAVYGTVNDLSVSGAKPLYLSTGFIIEEGLPMDDLWKIVVSMKEAAEKSGVQIITGDTKVVEKGKGDKVFINTSGVGVVYDGVNISPKRCKPGDVIILSGKIADHGIAIMSAREGLQFETTIVSDTAPLNELVEKMLNASKNIHTMRDATRGGIASTLNEIAASANVGVYINENAIPINDQVIGACEILGLDPLYIANEGKLVAFVDPNDAEKVLDVMKSHPLGVDSKIIGEVVEDHPGRVVMKTSIGSRRIVDMISGEQLPRIC
ncbi:MAG: hydrogenase expression/formation protein HypE, partial [Melioribacteraceae bacterium]|nr:hydrogenase expression/formation protein HypE [Melioribacteraceae bacterium]